MHTAPAVGLRLGVSSIGSTPLLILFAELHNSKISSKLHPFTTAVVFESGRSTARSTYNVPSSLKLLRLIVSVKNLGRHFDSLCLRAILVSFEEVVYNSE